MSLLWRLRSVFSSVYASPIERLGMSTTQVVVVFYGLSNPSVWILMFMEDDGGSCRIVILC